MATSSLMNARTATALRAILLLISERVLGLLISSVV